MQLKESQQKITELNLYFFIQHLAQGDQLRLGTLQTFPVSGVKLDICTAALDVSKMISGIFCY